MNPILSDRPVLVIGPLPPPFGGARVSFKLFLDFLKNYSDSSIKYFDLPIRTKISDNLIGKVDHFKTIIGLFRSILTIPVCRSVVIFGSRGFCFSYGIFICVLSEILGKHSYVRFFGGRPIPYLKKYPKVIQKTIFWGLRYARRISIETKIGAYEFPEFLHTKFEVIPGYRNRMPTETSSQSVFDSCIRFVYVGGISVEKGIDILLESFSKLLDQAEEDGSFELHLYGGGSGILIEAVEKDSDVFYHGQIENLELRRQLASYDVFVFPSVYDNEGHPGVLIEALMAGLPIISTNQPVIREFLFDDINCLLIEPGNIDALCAAMTRMANDPTLRGKFSKASLETSSMFDAAKVLPKLAKTFEI
jgi:glycosyltransferase involved in cell wall biosynthesis